MRLFDWIQERAFIFWADLDWYFAMRARARHKKERASRDKPVK